MLYIYKDVKSRKRFIPLTLKDSKNGKVPKIAGTRPRRTTFSPAAELALEGLYYKAIRARIPTHLGNGWGMTAAERLVSKGF